MWRFRVTRPLLLTVIIVNVVHAIFFSIMGLRHATMSGWTSIAFTTWAVVNLVIIWLDGVN